MGSASLPEELLAAVVTEPVPGAIRYILHTQVGELWGDVWQGGPISVPRGCVGPHPQGCAWTPIPVPIPRGGT